MRFGDGRIEVSLKKEPITEKEARSCFYFVTNVILSVQE